MNGKLDYLLRDLCAELRQPDADTDEAIATGVVDVDGTAILISAATDDRTIALTALLDPPDDTVPPEMLDEQILIHDFRTIDDTDEIRFSRPPGPEYLVAASLMVSHDQLDSGRELLALVRAFRALAEDRLVDLCALALASCLDALDLTQEGEAPLPAQPPAFDATRLLSLRA